MVGLDRRFVLHRRNRHRGVSRQKFRHEGGMARVEMLDQHERHPAIRRHVAEETLEGLETSRRCSHADHRELARDIGWHG